ncbi:metal-dependent hydrolase [candidate division KSB1 bacterium]|nr:metal-dependent hydrolase [candidate division KSB1 bacterium]
MPTPIGHSLLGGIIFQGTQSQPRRWRQGLLFILIANLADIDYVPGLLIGAPNLYHHGVTHSLLAAFSVGLALALIYKFILKKEFAWYFIIFSMLYFSHLLLDYFAMDTLEPFGIPLFWPISENYYISPIQIFSDVYKGSTNTSFFKSILVQHNLLTALKELIILGILGGVVLFVKKFFSSGQINWRKIGSGN